MKILLAVDDSPASASVAKALSIYPPERTEVRVLNVVEWPGRLPPYYSFAEGDGMARALIHVRDRMRVQGDALVTSVADTLRRDGFAATGLVTVGDARSEIVDRAAEWGADLIIVGSHGRNRLDRLAFGSVAEGVLRRATCAVEVVPPDASAVS
jgi:nucleotide-binding universal stress UspA family protein